MNILDSVYAAPYAGLLRPPLLRMRLTLGMVQELRPSAWTVFALIMLSYFLVTGGIIYDMIIEPPSMGYEFNERGQQRPVAFMTGRINGQYIMEGLTSSFIFVFGGFGFIALDWANRAETKNDMRIVWLSLGAGLVLVTYMLGIVFINYKVPGYW